MKRQLMLFVSAAIAVSMLLGVVLADELSEKDKKLFEAMKEEKLADVKAALEAGANVNARDKDGKSPLHLSWYSNSPEIAKYLIDKGAKVDARDKNGNTPLHWSAMNDDEARTIGVFLESGADINARNKDKYTPLHIAIFRHNKEAVKMLLSKGAKVNLANNLNLTPLDTAEWFGYKEIAQMLKAGKAKNGSGRRKKEIALAFAANAGDLDEVKKQVKAGAKVDSDVVYGTTPLMTACHNGREGVAEYLISNKADVNKEDEGNSTALHFAAMGGHIAVVKLLVEKNAKIDTRDSHKYTPLAWAVANNHLETAKFLVEKGADVNVKTDMLGQYILHGACSRGYLEIAKLLLENGARVNVKNELGASPLDEAMMMRRKEIVELLKKHGAKSGRDF